VEGDHVGSFARLLARSTFPVTVEGDHFGWKASKGV
jgi:hypothetical protein